MEKEKIDEIVYSVMLDNTGRGICVIHDNSYGRANNYYVASSLGNEDAEAVLIELKLKEKHVYASCQRLEKDGLVTFFNLDADADKDCCWCRALNPVEIVKWKKQKS